MELWACRGSGPSVLRFRAAPRTLTPASNPPLLACPSFALVFFVTMVVVDSLKRLRMVLAVAVGSVAFASLYVVREWQVYHNVFSEFRPGAVTGDSNYFVLSAVICMPVAFYLMVEQKSTGWRVFWAGSLAVTLVATTLASSRGGFLGTVAAFLYLVMRSRRRT